MIEGLAIIDNQSTTSWIDSMVDNRLGISSEFIKHSPYFLSTIDTLDSAEEGRVINGCRLPLFKAGPLSSKTLENYPDALRGAFHQSRMEWPIQRMLSV